MCTCDLCTLYDVLEQSVQSGYDCKMCGKTFKSRSDLNNHLISRNLGGHGGTHTQPHPTYCDRWDSVPAVRKWSHIKIKGKISYLGEKISILSNQMTEKLSVEKVVLAVTDGGHYFFIG